ncbi:Hypothetical protein CINCED_3A003183 [Cinara cedri]|nr:Hypothetical protein CINCED_3A003183 [Cinara cedri]
MPNLRPTKFQMKRLVELVSMEPHLMTGTFSVNFNCQNAKEKWKKIANELNALPGAKKSYEKWKKAWHDTKTKNTKYKKKAADIKKHVYVAGGEQSCNITLSDAQMNTLNQVVVNGGCHKVFRINGSESAENFDFSTIKNGANKHNSSSSIDGTNDIENTNSVTLPAYTDNHIIEFTTDFKIKEEPTEETTSEIESTLGTQRFQENNDVANRMAELAAKKIEIKSAYYSKKIKLMEDKNAILRNINVLLMSYINKKASH